MLIQFRCLRQILYAKIFHIRTLTLFLLQSGFLYFYIKPLLKYAADVSYPPSPWVFPFIISNLYCLFLFMLEIVFYFSDVPFMQYPNMYQVIRAGRVRWAVSQILAIMIQSFFIMLFNIIMSIIFLGRYCEFTLEWGKLLHTVALANISEAYHFLFAVPYNTLQNFSPVELMALTFIIGGLVISFVALVMFAVSLFVGRTAGVTAGLVMTVMIYFVENIHPLLTKKIAMFVPVDWMRVANVGIKQHDSFVLPSLQYILMFLTIGIAVLFVVIVWKIKRVEFQWVKED